MTRSVNSILLAASLSLLPCAAVEPVVRTNVLLICIDDLKPTLGCYGDARVRTPHIDRLASQGTVFHRAYTQQAVCAASRNTLMTGLRPDQLGIYDLGTFFRISRPDCQTLPQAFQVRGWTSISLGKIYHPTHGNSDDPAGWSERPWYPWQDKQRRLFSLKVPKGDKIPAWAAPDVPDEDMPDAVTASEAVRRLDEFAISGAPFFLAVGFAKPHLPFIAPKRWWDGIDASTLVIEPVDAVLPTGAPACAGSGSSELRTYAGIPGKDQPVTAPTARSLLHGYLACTAFIDHQIGRVMASLERNRMRDRTVVVLWGDHGWHLGDHGLWGKHTNFEQAVRHPLIICAPGRHPGVADGLVATMDVYPTLCALTGIEPPPGLPGRSLVPMLEDPTVRVNDQVIHVWPRGGSVLGRAVRTAAWRYVEWRRWEDGAVQMRELYDMVGDARETRNLVDDPVWAAACVEGARRLAALGDPIPQVKTPTRPGKD